MAISPLDYSWVAGFAVALVLYAVLSALAPRGKLAPATVSAS